MEKNEICFESTMTRKMNIKTSILHHADGSAMVQQGLTSVLVSLNGPDQVQSQKEMIDRTYIEVRYQSKHKPSNCEDKEKEHLLASICDEIIEAGLHPRTSILLHIQELHDDGGLLSCAINALIMSLIDAGVPMKSIAAAATCAVDEEGNIKVDPTKEMIETAVATVILVVENKNNQILALKTTGTIKAKLLENCLSKLQEACQETLTLFRTYITGITVG